MFGLNSYHEGMTRQRTSTGRVKGNAHIESESPYGGHTQHAETAGGFPTETGVVREMLKRIRVFVDEKTTATIVSDSESVLAQLQTVIADAREALETAGRAVGEVDVSIQQTPENTDIQPLWEGIDHLHLAQFYIEEVVNTAWSPNNHQLYRLLTDAASELADAYEAFDAFTESSAWAAILVTPTQ